MHFTNFLNLLQQLDNFLGGGWRINKFPNFIERQKVVPKFGEEHNFFT
jgi:hypothetical protein